MQTSLTHYEVEAYSIDQSPVEDSNTPDLPGPRCGMRWTYGYWSPHWCVHPCRRARRLRDTTTTPEFLNALWRQQQQQLERRVILKPPTKLLAKTPAVSDSRSRSRSPIARRLPKSVTLRPPPPKANHFTAATHEQREKERIAKMQDFINGGHEGKGSRTRTAKSRFVYRE